MEEFKPQEVSRYTFSQECRLRLRVSVFLGIATFVVSVFLPVLPPANSEEPPAGDSPAYVAKAEKSAKATTVSNPSVPLNELRLLVKPLSVEELQVEADAWLSFVKENGKAISNVEVAILRQSVAIEKQSETASQLDLAKKALEEAEKAQASTSPGTPEYEAAVKKLEEAKENLRKAQESLAEVDAAKKDLKTDKELAKTLKDAEVTGVFEESKVFLNELEKARDALPSNSSAYQNESKRIDALKKSIENFDSAQKARRELEADPTSPKFKEADKAFQKAKTTLEQSLVKAKGGSGSEAKNTSSESAKAIKDTKKVLQQADSQTSKSGSDGLKGKGAALEQASQELVESAEKEADLKQKLVLNVTELQSTQTALVDRLNVVLAEFERKGGDPKPYRSYIEAITKAEIDVKDTEALYIRIIGWLNSEQGGKRWLVNLAKFTGIVIGSWVASLVLALALNPLFKMWGASKVLRQFTVMLLGRGGIVVGVLLGLTALEVSLGPILALLGGATFVLAFALQSNLGNLASGLMIMINKPFDIGDEVVVAGVRGFVHSFDITSTRIAGYYCEIFTIPNNAIWSGTIENKSIKGGVRQGMIDVHVPLTSDWEQVTQLLEQSAKDTPDGRLVFACFWSLDEHFAKFRIRWEAEQSSFWSAYDQIHMNVKKYLEESGIPFALPTTILLNGYENNVPWSNTKGGVIRDALNGLHEGEALPPPPPHLTESSHVPDGAEAQDPATSL